MPSRTKEILHLDFAPGHRQPRLARVGLAAVAALIGSLAADALLVVIGEAIFPSTDGYTHFQFSDYAPLTIIGVLVACAAWPVVTRITSSPRWMFSRMAVLVTLVLWVPDVGILVQGQPARAVGVLILMHLAIALMTYHLLVRVASCLPGSERPGVNERLVRRPEASSPAPPRA